MKRNKKQTAHPSLRYFLPSVFVFFFLLLFEVYPLLSMSSLQEKFLLPAATSVGMFASVSQNEHNTLAADLKMKEDELQNREMALVQKETEAQKNHMPLGVRDLQVPLVGALLALLLGLNFYLDYRRTAKRNEVRAF